MSSRRSIRLTGQTTASDNNESASVIARAA
jgi:hypothetical protein